MKLIANLKKFKKFFGMTAQVRNSDGDVLDSVDITKTGKKKVTFKFGKEEALGGDKKAEVTIVFTDTNGDKKNFQKISTKSLISIQTHKHLHHHQTKNKKKVAINLPAQNRQPTACFYLRECCFHRRKYQRRLLYLATATDKSDPIDFTLSGPDASAFSIATVTNFSSSVSINASPDFEKSRLIRSTLTPRIQRQQQLTIGLSQHQQPARHW